MDYASVAEELVPSVTSESAETEILRTARSDPAAFESLYQLYFPRIYAYCLRQLGHPEDAEDLTSFIFAQAIANLRSYRGGSVAAWLFRIAHNAVANHWRSHRPNQSLDEPGIVSPIVDAASSHQLDRVEDRLRIAQLIAVLPPRQQELLALSILGGLTAKEVGQVVGKSEGAVWTALHRIIQSLRTACERAEEGT